MAMKDTIVICVENLPPRRDRRVWRQALALRDAGHHVVVIGQRGPDDVPERFVDGVHLLTYRPPIEASSPVGFVWEYLASFVRTAVRVRRVVRHGDVRAVQVCNPPDIFFPFAWYLRRRGVAFVFDHHDLVPELFRTRYGQRGRAVLRILRWCERASLRAADRVIATNESYRAREIERGGIDPGTITVVRNGPDVDDMYRRAERPELREGHRHLVVWFGNMGRQDGVDRMLDVVANMVHERGRRDVLFAFVGRGEMLAEMQARATRLDLADHTTFTGWAPDDEAFAYLSTADVGISADPPGPLNDVSTMNKTMEYMAFELPVVAFDLPETRVSAGPAALYADDPVGFADAIEKLLDDEGLRHELGQLGRRRIVDELSWNRQARAYVDLYEGLG